MKRVKGLLKHSEKFLFIGLLTLLASCEQPGGNNPKTPSLRNWPITFTEDDSSILYNFVSAAIRGPDGTLYVGSHSDGKLYAVNPVTLAVKWSFDTLGSSIQSSPAVATDGTIYVAEFHSGTVYAVNPDGTQKWLYNAGANITSSLAINAVGTVFGGTDSGSSSVLFALDPDTGTEIWQFALDDTTRSSVSFATDGTVYARDYAGNLFALNPADGSVEWQVDPILGGGSGSPPIVGSDGTIYFGSFLGSTDSRFYAVNPNGSVKWEKDLGGNLYGIAAAASLGSDGTIYIGVREPDSFNGAIYAVDINGDIKWRYPLDSMASSTAIADDGTVYVATGRGTIYALDPVTGAENWTYSTLQPGISNNSPGPLTIGPDGTIYTYTSEGLLHAISESGVVVSAS